MRPSLGAAQQVGLFQAASGECLYTAMLCLVVFSVAATKKNQPNNHFGLAIGLTIVGAGSSLGKVSGGVLNPAVAMGILATEPSGSARPFPALVLGELLGAVLAFGICRIVHQEEFSGEGEADAEAGPFAKLTAEFVGTFYLVLSVVLSVLS